jgi:sec-independent protein translocase protein TatA
LIPNIGPLELIIILAIALLIVGPGRLPEMGSAIGRTIREFRKASSDLTDATRTEMRPNTLSGQATPNQPATSAQAEPAEAAPAEPAARLDDAAADPEAGSKG